MDAEALKQQIRTKFEALKRQAGGINAYNQEMMYVAVTHLMDHIHKLFDLPAVERKQAIEDISYLLLNGFETSHITGILTGVKRAERIPSIDQNTAQEVQQALQTTLQTLLQSSSRALLFMQIWICYMTEGKSADDFLDDCRQKGYNGTNINAAMQEARILISQIVDKK